MTYLLTIAAATLLRAVAIAADIARARVVRLRLVVQAIAGIPTSELGPYLLEVLQVNSIKIGRYCIFTIIIISIFKEGSLFSISASLPYGPPVNTDIDYYQTFFGLFYF